MVLEVKEEEDVGVADLLADLHLLVENLGGSLMKEKDLVPEEMPLSAVGEELGSLGMYIGIPRLCRVSHSLFYFKVHPY